MLCLWTLERGAGARSWGSNVTLQLDPVLRPSCSQPLQPFSHLFSTQPLGRTTPFIDALTVTRCHGVTGVVRGASVPAKCDAALTRYCSRTGCLSWMEDLCRCQNAERESSSASGVTLSAATGSRRNARGGPGATRGSRAACSAQPARGCAAGARRGTTGGPPVARLRAVAGSLCAWRARRGSRRRRRPRATAWLPGS